MVSIMSDLRPCASCHRHVIGEGACPFCGDESARPMVGGVLVGRYGRAARLFLGAAIVAGAAVGCGSSTTPTDGAASEDAGVDSGPVVTPYGAPALLDMTV